MNAIYSPYFRNVLRYMYNGHDAYFKFREVEFDPITGMPKDED